MVRILCLGLSPCYMLIPVWSADQKPLLGHANPGAVRHEETDSHVAELWRTHVQALRIYTGLPPGSPTARQCNHWGQVLQNNGKDENTVELNDAQQVIEAWEQIKLKEKDGNKSVLAGVPKALPSIIKAYRIQDKARNVGFDWEDSRDVWHKVREELAELEEELEKGDKERAEKEFGDFLFSLVNAGRLYGLNPDTALEETNKKFIKRFNYIEEHSLKIGKPLKEMTLGEMDALWNEAKRNE